MIAPRYVTMIDLEDSPRVVIYARTGPGSPRGFATKLEARAMADKLAEQWNCPVDDLCGEPLQ